VPHTPRGNLFLFVAQRIEFRLDASTFPLHALENASAVRVVRRAIAAFASYLQMRLSP